MFENCPLINDVKIYVKTDTSSQGNSAFENWLKGAAATGDIYNYGGITLPAGDSGIPEGWTEHRMQTYTPS